MAPETGRTWTGYGNLYGVAFSTAAEPRRQSDRKLAVGRLITTSHSPPQAGDRIRRLENGLGRTIRRFVAIRSILACPDPS